LLCFEANDDLFIETCSFSSIFPQKNLDAVFFQVNGTNNIVPTSGLVSIFKMNSILSKLNVLKSGFIDNLKG